MKTIGTGRESFLEDDDVVFVYLNMGWCEGTSAPRYLCMLRKDAVPYQNLFEGHSKLQIEHFLFPLKKLFRDGEDAVPYFSRVFNGTIVIANPSSGAVPAERNQHLLNSIAMIV